MEDRVLVCVRDGQAVICGDADSRENIIAFDTGTFGTYALASRSLVTGPDTESEGFHCNGNCLGSICCFMHPVPEVSGFQIHIAYENATSGQWDF